ncbi:hypothetical protein ACPFZN_003646 [Vibrio cholerae]
MKRQCVCRCKFCVIASLGF